jgi:hypothetical protein
MTLANIVLQKLSEAKPAAGRHELAFTDEASGWSLYVTADRRDDMSLLVWELSLRRPENGGDVAAWATRLAATTTFPIEPLKVVEIDAPRRQALVRSANPTQRKDRLFYYELILQGTGSALVRRFSASQEGVKREQIAFALTHEALARLVEELTAD